MMITKPLPLKFPDILKLFRSAY